MTQVAINQADALERQLAASGAASVEYATAIAIFNQQDYEQAAQYLVEVKRRAKAVKDYWAAPKASAKAAHQAIVDKEQSMLAPLAQSESIVKRKLAEYQASVEAERRQREQEARRLKQLEAERMLERAIGSEQSGDAVSAQQELAMAQMIEDMPVTVTAAVAPAPKGISLRNVWGVRIIDERAVPSYFQGMQLRGIDISALKAIARSSQGTAQIPGVEFVRQVTISART